LNKTILGTTLLTFALVGTACSDDFATNDVYPENGNTINVSDRQDLYNKDGRDSEDFGYVRQQKSPVEGQPISYKDMYTVDREKVADAISRMSIALPNVNDSSTLVTDEEVLVSYVTDKDKKDKDGRFAVADQVKRTAMSVVPRWYHVYVTDDPNLMRDVENLASMDTDMDNVNTAIDDTINLMLKASPQGNKVDAGENANGEMTQDKYELQDDDVHQINRERQKRNDHTEESNNENNTGTTGDMQE
jgi:hypothetical protein